VVVPCCQSARFSRGQNGISGFSHELRSFMLYLKTAYRNTMFLKDKHHSRIVVSERGETKTEMFEALYL
jgi:hypothetical protein